MTKRTEQVVDRLKSYIDRLRGMKRVEDAGWHEPVSPGKWSAADIVAHIMFWDIYLLEKTIPELLIGNELHFVDHDEYNAEASKFARSGILMPHLLEMAAVERMELVRKLQALPSEAMLKPLSVNGLEQCPKTGEYYSLIYVLEEFTAHDAYHGEQLSKKLKLVLH